ncbi:Rv1733c family protein [Streptomyces lavendulocolor]
MPPAVWTGRWREHPLRRRVDVVEARLLLLVGVAVVVGAPAVGTAADWSAYGHDRAAAAVQEATRRPVRAEVVEDAPASSAWADETGRLAKVPLEVRWTTADGQRATATVLVPAGTGRGDRAEIWLDRPPGPARGRTVEQRRESPGRAGLGGGGLLNLSSREFAVWLRWS